MANHQTSPHGAGIYEQAESKRPGYVRYRAVVWDRGRAKRHLGSFGSAIEARFARDLFLTNPQLFEWIYRKEKT